MLLPCECCDGGEIYIALDTAISTYVLILRLGQVTDIFETVQYNMLTVNYQFLHCSAVDNSILYTSYADAMVVMYDIPPTD